MDTQPLSKEQLAALEAFLPKLPCLTQGCNLTVTEAEWLSLLKRVHKQYCRYIDQQDSFELSCATLWLCFREGCGDVELACKKAHHERLRPRRRKRHHASIDEEGAEEPADTSEECDEAVQSALRSLNDRDERLLRNKYFGEKQTTKELAEDARVSDTVMRQRLARARDRFRTAYERQRGHDWD